MYKLKITIPCSSGKELPKSTNSMKTYQHRIWEISRWRRIVPKYILIYPKKPLRNAEIICQRHSSREQDPDNLVASFKAIIDVLVKIGILRDDNSKFLTRKYEHVKCKKGEFKIVLIIKEVTNEQDIHNDVLSN